MRWLGLTLVLVCGSLAWGDNDALAVRAQLQADYPGVQYYEQFGQLTSVYAVPMGGADSPELSAKAFVQEYSKVFGVTADELAPGLAFHDRYTVPMGYQPDTGTFKFTLVYYHQHLDGIPVFRSDLRLLVRNVEGYPLVLARSGLRPLGDFVVPQDFTGFVAEGAAHAAAMAAVPSLVHFSPADLVIWAGLEDLDASPAVAITFTADSGDGSDPYENWLFVADAMTGAILYQESLVYHVDIVGTVKGNVTQDYRADPCAPKEWVGLPYLRVTRSGGETFTDVDGNFVLPNPGSTPVDVTSTLNGRWFWVQNNGTGGNASITQNVTPPGPVHFQHNLSGAEHQTAEVNAYLQANIVRDMILESEPLFPGIYNQSSMRVTVNINSTCNAYYSASTINFYRSGGGCNNTAFGDVVHHEYGHHAVAMSPSGQGAYGEGMSDSLAMLITGRSQMALGFQNCSTPIRNADNNCKYLVSGCSTCGSAIHTCGQLLSGCIWDTWKELKITEPIEHLEIIRRLTVGSILLRPQNSTAITPQITIDFLILDDDDGNLNNGTPHYFEIATGFGKHDMPAPPLSLLGFDYPNGKPEFINPNGGTTVRVEVGAIAGTPKTGSGKFHYNLGSGWVTVPMNEVAPNVYDAVFPAVACGNSVRYYFSAETTNNMTVRDPADAPATTFGTLSGYGLSLYFEDDFDTDKGWTIHAGATLGNWERATPQQTSSGGVIYQPGQAFKGTRCYVTGPLAGSSVGAHDVDGPWTRITSPVLDLSDSDAIVSYWRWYHISTQIDDEFHIEVSNDNGATWVLVERILQREAPWVYAEWIVGNYVTPTAQVRVRFSADDDPNNSIVEALVDDFQVRKIDCNPPYAKGDLNCDGSVNFGDINPFVLALTNPAGYVATYPNCDIMLADINNDGIVDFADINPFVTLLTSP